MFSFSPLFRLVGFFTLIGAAFFSVSVDQLHAGAATATPSAIAGTTTPTPLPKLTLTWSSGALADGGTPIALSSPLSATLRSTPSVVVGDRAGNLYGLSLSTGATITGWPVKLQGPIDSAPTLGSKGTVFVGVGNAGVPTPAGEDMIAISPTARVKWSTMIANPTTDVTAPTSGVIASPVQITDGGVSSIFAATLGQEAEAVSTTTGALSKGWPFFTSDSTFSTASVANLYGTGANEIVEGGAQTAGFGLGQHYSAGGHIRVLSTSGALLCQATPTETIDSSPAVGGFLLSGATGIVTGTGTYYPSAADKNSVLAYTNTCAPAWKATLDGSTSASVILAPMGTTSQLDVIAGTQTSSTTGSIWVLNGTNGKTLWHAATTGAVIGSPVTANLTGKGYQDILVPTTLGVDIFDGQSHTQVAVLNGATGKLGVGVLGFQNSPLVTKDPNGTVGITVAGYGLTGSSLHGFVEHYEIGTSNGATAIAGGAWPTFHHDAQRTGNATKITKTVTRCTIPSALFAGYNIATSSGPLYSFTTPSCGLPSGVNSQIVAAAAAPGRGGYWIASASGAVYAYGGARLLGSPTLNTPLAAMAATPDGLGYWLVTTNGAVFAYGDATYYGGVSTTNIHSTIVGIAATADGLGYRLAAANGAVYDFGPSAQYFGAMNGHVLNKPIVAIADDSATGGYWLIASDGGVFSFNAPFYGSTGGITLSQPITFALATVNGYGYRFFAKDGGVFCFGLGAYKGSLPGIRVSATAVAGTY